MPIHTLFFSTLSLSPFLLRLSSLSSLFAFLFLSLSDFCLSHLSLSGRANPKDRLHPPSKFSLSYHLFLSLSLFLSAFSLSLSFLKNLNMGPPSTVQSLPQYKSFVVWICFSSSLLQARSVPKFWNPKMGIGDLQAALLFFVCSLWFMEKCRNDYDVRIVGFSFCGD